MTTRQPAELNVQAGSCDGTRYHTVGDLVVYRSALWTVKGLYLGATETGQHDVFYILGEAIRPLPANKAHQRITM